MQELTREQVKMTKAKDKKCRRKAQVQFGLQSMQFGSIIYKGISYTKKGTTVSTKPNPQESFCGVGVKVAAWLEQTISVRSRSPPSKLVHCKSELFHFTFGFAVSVGKNTE